MKILECFTTCKHLDEDKNEDGVFFNENFVVVVDGTTTIGNRKTHKTGGQIAKECVLEYFEEAPADKDIEEIIRELNLIFKKYKKRNSTNVKASIIIYSERHQEIWAYGDCKLQINQQVYSHEKKVDTLMAEVRSYVLQAKKAEIRNQVFDKDKDFGRKSIEPYILLQKNLENDRSEFGFKVLNGSEQTLPVDIYRVEKGDEIIITSDGYPEIKRNLKETEEYLEWLLAVDPLCIDLNKQTKGKYSNQKSYDDRTFIRFVV